MFFGAALRWDYVAVKQCGVFFFCLPISNCTFPCEVWHPLGFYVFISCLMLDWKDNQIAKWMGFFFKCKESWRKIKMGQKRICSAETGGFSFLLWPDLSKCVRVEAGREIYFERMMKRGIKGVKGKDQKDKTAISFCTGLLLLTRPRHSAGRGDWISPLFSASPFVLLYYRHITSRHLSPPTWIFCLLVP